MRHVEGAFFDESNQYVGIMAARYLRSFVVDRNNKFLQERDVHCQSIECRGRMKSFNLGRLVVFRWLLAGTTLLAPASMVTAVSCGLGCNNYCEASGNGIPCRSLPASDCSSLSYCSVRTGCHCAGMSNTNVEPVGCNVNACAFVTTQLECLRTSGCEWSDACQDAFDCSTLDESACKMNTLCSWRKDC